MIRKDYLRIKFKIYYKEGLLNDKDMKMYDSKR